MSEEIVNEKMNQNEEKSTNKRIESIVVYCK
jgi:hypothetical protein